MTYLLKKKSQQKRFKLTSLFLVVKEIFKFFGIYHTNRTFILTECLNQCFLIKSQTRYWHLHCFYFMIAYLYFCRKKKICHSQDVWHSIRIVFRINDGIKWYGLHELHLNNSYIIYFRLFIYLQVKSHGLCDNSITEIFMNDFAKDHIFHNVQK